jgi:hypothetical protein
MVWGFCYLRIFKKVQSISGRSLHAVDIPYDHLNYKLERAVNCK